MCLHPRSIKPVPSETARVAKAALPEGSPYLTLRDELSPIFDDSDFAELVGQPALSTTVRARVDYASVQREPRTYLTAKLPKLFARASTGSTCSD